MKTVAITGHRPEKITDKNRTMTEIAQALTDVIMPAHLIQGMAAGVDLWSAQVAYKIGIPYTCARPWITHSARKADDDDYQRALDHATEIVAVSQYEFYPGPFVYQKRNVWMVDHADVVLAVWDGTPGGTANCAKYALDQGKPVYRINPATWERGWIEDKCEADK
jgi:uncharacterized phage-like protein YoqJ